MKSFTLLFCLWTTAIFAQNKSTYFERHWQIGAAYAAEWSSTFTQNDGFFGIDDSNSNHTLGYGYASSVHSIFQFNKSFGLRAYLNYANRNFTSHYKTISAIGSTSSIIDENLRTSYNNIEIGFGIIFAPTKLPNLFFSIGTGFANTLNLTIESDYANSPRINTSGFFFGSGGAFSHAPAVFFFGGNYTLVETRTIRFFLDAQFKTDVFRQGSRLINHQFFVWSIGLGGSVKLFN